MSLSIYNIPNWQAGTQYNLNDIVLNGQYYYYATTSFTANSNFQTDVNAGRFVGTTNYNNNVFPYFTWVSSYNPQAAYKPTVKQVQFGDGYMSVQPDSINNLVTMDIEFAERNLAETTAINHFLYVRAGYQSFAFIAPPPNATLFLYKCLSFNYIENFYDNYTTKAQFMQVVR